MRVTVLGCSGSFAGPRSPASGYLVRATAPDGRERAVVLDLGNGALGALQRHLDPADLDAVVLSHLHPDHCIDVTGLWVTRRYRPDGPPEDPLPVHGPAGAAERLAAAYEGMVPDGMRAELEFHDLADGTPIRVGPLTITPVAVSHPVEAYGFRVEADGAALAYTGDTDTCDALGPLLAGADLALVDSAFVEGRDPSRGIHLTGRRAAEAAVAAGGVRRLVLTHIPPWNDPEACRAEAAEIWPGAVELAAPDTTYELPARRDAPGGAPTPDRVAAARMWAACRRGLSLAPEDPPAECFGDSPELADELLGLVLDGRKRATAGLVAQFVADGEPLPRVGGHWVACDGRGAPRAVLRSTELRVGTLGSVDAAFAHDEGEGDRSVEGWLEAHRAWAGRVGPGIGVDAAGDDLEVVFERFTVVWPPEVADGPPAPSR